MAKRMGNAVAGGTTAVWGITPGNPEYQHMCDNQGQQHIDRQEQNSRRQ
jgi:hypothetical protein